MTPKTSRSFVVTNLFIHRRKCSRSHETRCSPISLTSLTDCTIVEGQSIEKNIPLRRGRPPFHEASLFFATELYKINRVHYTHDNFIRHQGSISTIFLHTNFSYECHFGSFFYVKNAVEMTRRSYEKRALLTLMKLTAEVDFTNILQAAFARTYPRIAKRHWWLDCLLCFLELRAWKLLVKSL